MSDHEPNNANEGQSRAGEAGANLTAGLAAKLARKIFECGDDLPQFGGKTQRIQFMGGTYPANERAMGGMNEMALASLIERVLTANSKVSVASHDD